MSTHSNLIWKSKVHITGYFCIHNCKYYSFCNDLYCFYSLKCIVLVSGVYSFYSLNCIPCMPRIFNNYDVKEMKLTPLNECSYEKSLIDLFSICIILTYIDKWTISHRLSATQFYQNNFCIKELMFSFLKCKPMLLSKILKFLIFFNIFLINSNPQFFRGHLATDWMSLIGASLEEQLKKLYLLL